MIDREYTQFLQKAFEEFIKPNMKHTRKQYNASLKKSAKVDWAVDGKTPPPSQRLLGNICHTIKYFSHDGERIVKKLNNVNGQACVYESMGEGHAMFTFSGGYVSVNELDSLIGALKRLRKEAGNTGYSTAIEKHHDEILKGLDIVYFPKEEFDIITMAGSADPERDIREMIDILRSNDLFKRHLQEAGSFKKVLNNLEKQLSGIKKDITREIDNLQEHGVPNISSSPKIRKWFKSISHIGQGTLIASADIALALGVLEFPVSAETKAWGSLVSVTTGIGMLLYGFGELRGE